MRPNVVSIPPPRSVAAQGVHRVTAQVAGQDIWFESADVALHPSSEAFATALLIPALHNNARIKPVDSVCPTWQQGAQAATALTSRWWQLPCLPPEAEPSVNRVSSTAAGTGLCFSGGLDSFHSLLRGRERPSMLIFVHGYDITLSDFTRFRAFRSSLHQVAAHSKTKPVTVTTNLREHPLVGRAPWNKTHGGALAAIAHLLKDHISQLVVASSVPRSYQIPWGSHWELDPLWSSGSVRIIHDGDDFSREEKAWAIAGEPLLTEHLRVCWENRSATGNCSTCDKCVSTMLLLRQARPLDAYRVFDPPESFVPLLNALPRTTFVRVYRAMCRRGLAAEEEAAVKRLLARTERRARWTAFRTRLRSAFNQRRSLR